MAATPPPRPVSQRMWVLIWLGGVDSLRLTYSSELSQVSVRQHESIWWFTSLAGRNLIFKSPHLILLFSFTFLSMDLIFDILMWVTPPLWTLELIHVNVVDWGTDTDSIVWVGNCPNGSSEKCVGLQLCDLVSTLDCQGSRPLYKIGQISR